jgi:hypothetical protein
VTLYRTNAAFRRFCQSIDHRWVILAQAWRIRAVDFLVQSSKGRLAPGFGIPAGVGDIVAGAGAIALYLISRRSHRDLRRWLIAWNLFGIADLAVAVSSGILHSESSLGILATRRQSTRLMSELPRSLVPTFFVPLFVQLHLLSLSRANEWAQQAPAGTA